MSQQTLPVLENSLQKTHEWLRDITEVLGLETKHDAYAILRGVLHAVRDRLPPEMAVKLGAQLPLIIRGIYYDEWVLKNTPIKIHQPQEFLRLVDSYIDNIKLTPLTSEDISRVLGVVGGHITPEELLKVAQLFPEKLRLAIFPEIIFQL